MSLVQTIYEVEYPESDGMPMGETDVHIDWMIRIRDILKYRYRGQQVYVGSNLLVYYEEGSPHKFVVPDDFVVKDCNPGQRRTFKIWEEGQAPDVVFEITSLGSRREDQSYKPSVYARLGVSEYFLYDPTGDYLKPPLQGFRLQGAEHARIEEDDSGALESRELGMHLRLDEGRLVLSDVETGAVQLTEAESIRAERNAAEAERNAAEAARATERAAREAAEARAAELEAELDRLRSQLKRDSGDS